MDIAQRIAQFENMVQADPTNDMVHYSLAGAYAQAGRHRDAAEKRCLLLPHQPRMSKAYQLAGAEFIKCNDTVRAAEVLKEGYTVAAQRGDFMPKKAIADLLKQINVALPEVAGEGRGGPAAGDVCVQEDRAAGASGPRSRRSRGRSGKQGTHWSQ